MNWLAFLNKYKLHGILCDDMGLGKTLQSICILAGDHYNRQQEYLVSFQNAYQWSQLCNLHEFLLIAVAKFLGKG